MVSVARVVEWMIDKLHRRETDNESVKERWATEYEPSMSWLACSITKKTPLSPMKGEAVMY